MRLSTHPAVRAVTEETQVSVKVPSQELAEPAGSEALPVPERKVAP
jgi:hypothetical protein